MQLVMLDAVQLQTTGFLDAGTVNFISHLVGIGGDGLAGLGVEAIFEFEDLALDLSLVKASWSSVMKSHIRFTTSQFTNPIIPVYGGCLLCRPSSCVLNLHQIQAGECKSGRALYQKNAGMQSKEDKYCAPLQKMTRFRQGLTENMGSCKLVGTGLAVGRYHARVFSICPRDGHYMRRYL